MLTRPKMREATMRRAFWWAAFLALVTLLWVSGPKPAAANGRGPTYACFSPQNAAVIGRLGANDPTVRYGFETGACLALGPGAPVSDVERHGSVWKFRVMGARPYLFAADWAAGFQGGQAPPGFEQYLPVTARLMVSGRTLADCDEAWEKLSERLRDHERRWKRYQGWSRTKLDGSGSAPIVVIYVSDTGPKLVAEGAQLRKQALTLERRCASVASLEFDDGFLSFARTARL
jgi:hypothetical protein